MLEVPLTVLAESKSKCVTLTVQPTLFFFVLFFCLQGPWSILVCILLWLFGRRPYPELKLTFLFHLFTHEQLRVKSLAQSGNLFCCGLNPGPFDQ